jgi:hypothetical protein
VYQLQGSWSRGKDPFRCFDRCRDTYREFVIECGELLVVPLHIFDKALVHGAFMAQPRAGPWGWGQILKQKTWHDKKIWRNEIEKPSAEV